MCVYACMRVYVYTCMSVSVYVYYELLVTLSFPHANVIFHAMDSRWALEYRENVVKLFNDSNTVQE